MKWFLLFLVITLGVATGSLASSYIYLKALEHNHASNFEQEDADLKKLKEQTELLEAESEQRLRELEEQRDELKSQQLRQQEALELNIIRV
ncbi:hypothetical protein [Marinimicrobium sp. ABcell2]|uniref:hypothetical protein n=1 Tax=Marinimicrobium sp. ABcell2 TaxID=3069751 RepID=UPI0027B45A95|nr:hypothetical protein [Marinimicrobium sp. ABcell2]MDQ2075874.1 hypothetical protein [Marinimicrobium sp. ABcell2]